MTREDEITTILACQNDHGGPYWSREDGDIHAPNGEDTISTLQVLGELGATADKYPMIGQALEFVLGYQSEDGSFRYSRASSRLPCMTARILSAFGRLGASDDPRLHKSYHQLLDTQWTDGGWRCNTVKLGKSPLTDASNPGTTLYVLDAFRFRPCSQEERDQLNRGVDFLLHHWEVRQPMGPCEFGIGSRFFQVEFPFLRYNLFYYAYVLSFYDHALKDRRFARAIHTLSTKAKNGKIIPENPHRAWRTFDFAKRGKASGQASRRWREVIGNVPALNL